MIKKLVVGLLMLTIVGGIASAFFSQPSSTTPESTPLTAPETAPAEVTNVPNQAVNTSASMVGEVWSGSGILLELTDVGMKLEMTDGSTIFVELGPERFWSAQGIVLLAGARVTVDGFFNGTDYHARAVTTSAGEVLTVRDENGSPLWSGENNSGSTGGQGEVQIPADEWVTIEGSVTALTNNGLVLRLTDGSPLTVSFGRADFWQQQPVTFAVEDAISMLGFWQGDQFSPGQVTKTATGERILLRDPNGRPLWAGPGRGQGNSSGGQGNGNGNQGSGNGGQSNGNGGQRQHAEPTATATATPSR